MNDIWFSWKKKWDWISQIATRREWEHDGVIISPPISLIQMNDLENELNITFPKDFKEVLTHFSSGVDIRWYFENEEPEKELNDIYFGGEDLWRFEELKDTYENYIGWKEVFTEIEDDFDKQWQNKVPFKSMRNGDVLAFDSLTNNVIYLSHDGHELHGKKLANNFTDFISRWSELGCPGPECWILDHFYDYEKNEIDLNSNQSLKWKNWLEEK